MAAKGTSTRRGDVLHFGAVFGLTLVVAGFMLVHESSPRLTKPLPLPFPPGRLRLAGCGCPRPEGGRLDVEVEVTGAERNAAGNLQRSLVWRLTDGTDSVLLETGSGNCGTALPSGSSGEDLEIFLGCDGNRVAIAAFDCVAAHDLQTGRRLWSLALPRSVASARNAFASPGLDCFRLPVDDGQVTVPVAHGDMRMQMATGAPK